MDKLTNYDSRFNIARESISNESIKNLTKKLTEYRDLGKNIVIMGNGGSNSLAAHFAEDLNKCPIRNYDNLIERRFSAIPLSDIAALTAYGNDLNYEEVFAQQAINYLQDGGLSFIISASGNSPNIIKAIETSKEMGAETFGLIGFDGGKAKDILDDYILAKTNKGDYRVAEDLHLQVCHKVIELLLP